MAAGKSTIFQDITYVDGKLLEANLVTGAYLKENFALSYVPIMIKQCHVASWIDLGRGEKPHAGSSYYIMPQGPFEELVNNAAVLSSAVYKLDRDKSLHIFEKETGRHSITKVARTLYGDYHFMIAEDEECVYIVFPGSKNTDDWIRNIDVELIDEDFLMGTFHEGFLKTAKKFPKSIITKLIADSEIKKLVFCGHSAGGAVAAITMMRFVAFLRRQKNGIAKLEKLQCITFAAPAFGKLDVGVNAKAAWDLVPLMCHFVNESDIVPSFMSIAAGIAKRKTDSALADAVGAVTSLIKVLLPYAPSDKKRAELIVDLCKKIGDQKFKKLPHLGNHKLFIENEVFDALPEQIENLFASERVGVRYLVVYNNSLESNHKMVGYKELVQKNYHYSSTEEIIPVTWNENYLPKIDDAVIVIETDVRGRSKGHVTVYLTLYGENIYKDLCIGNNGLVDIILEESKNDLKLEVTELEEPVFRGQFPSAIKVQGRIKENQTRDISVISVTRLLNMFGCIKEPFHICAVKVHVNKVAETFSGSAYVTELIKSAIQRSLIFAALKTPHKIITEVKNLTKLVGDIKDLEKLDGVFSRQPLTKHCDITNEITKKCVAFIRKAKKQTAKTGSLPEKLKDLALSRKNQKHYDKLLSNLIEELEKLSENEVTSNKRVHGSVSAKEEAIMNRQLSNLDAKQFTEPLHIVRIVREVRLLLDKDIFVAFVGQYGSGTSKLIPGLLSKGAQEETAAIEIYQQPPPQDNVYFLKFPCTRLNKFDDLFHSLVFMNDVFCTVVKYDDSDGSLISGEAKDMVARVFVDVFQDGRPVEVMVCINQALNMVIEGVTRESLATLKRKCANDIADTVTKIWCDIVKGLEEGCSTLPPLPIEYCDKICHSLRITDDRLSDMPTSPIKIKAQSIGIEGSREINEWIQCIVKTMSSSKDSAAVATQDQQMAEDANTDSNTYNVDPNKPQPFLDAQGRIVAPNGECSKYHPYIVPAYGNWFPYGNWLLGMYAFDDQTFVPQCYTVQGNFYAYVKVLGGYEVAENYVVEIEIRGGQKFIRGVLPSTEYDNCTIVRNCLFVPSWTVDQLKIECNNEGNRNGFNHYLHLKFQLFKKL